ncbi:MAG: CapA family protein [Chloroflexi bacterium]|nr:CapA family protein [Chloroflexota bacterium]
MSSVVTFFLCGDVMTGRGIDQVLPHPGDPTLFEPYVRDAGEYVALAGRATGPVPRPVDFAYVWGDAIAELDRVAPDARIVNLETSITKSNDHWKGKGIHYRMNPENIPCLKAVRIDCCSLANNHTLDWGLPGLTETIVTLNAAGIKTAGAGRNIKEARTPAVMQVGNSRVIVFAFGSETSGIPPEWAATNRRPGINMLPDFSDRTISRVADAIASVKRKGDIAIFSIHWGSNWGFDIPPDQVDFAHQLIDRAAIDIIYGHSSHHVRGIEVYRGKLILYGCGDFLNDYEGISGHEDFRGNLGLMYFPEVDSLSGKLVFLEMTPIQIKHLRVNRAAGADIAWLRDTLSREGAKFGTQVEITEDLRLRLHWKDFGSRC